MGYFKALSSRLLTFNINGLHAQPRKPLRNDKEKGDIFIFHATVLNESSPFALTASHFLLSGQEKVTKEKATPTSGSGQRPDFPPSGAAPGAGLQGPSLAL